MNYIDVLKQMFDTQERIAEAIGVSQPTVGNWIKGTFLPAPKNAKKIEKVTKGLVKKEQIRPDVFA